MNYADIAITASLPLFMPVNVLLLQTGKPLRHIEAELIRCFISIGNSFHSSGLLTLKDLPANLFLLVN